MDGFFYQHVCERRVYNERNLQQAREKFPSVFDSLMHLDVYIRWVNVPAILIVGRKEKVGAAFSLIEDTVKNVGPTQPTRFVPVCNYIMIDIVTQKI